jgi:hypothetical protein
MRAGRELTLQERKALEVLSGDHPDYRIKGQFPPGIGKQTLEALVALGLAEKGPSKRFNGEEGYKITADGWRAQFGMSYEDIVASGKPMLPLGVMRWPITDGGTQK